MKSYVVKVTHFAGQCRIAIPKKLAAETGLDEIKIVVLKAIKDNVIEIRGLNDGCTKG